MTSSPTTAFAPSSRALSRSDSSSSRSALRPGRRAVLDLVVLQEQLGADRPEVGGGARSADPRRRVELDVVLGVQRDLRCVSPTGSGIGGSGSGLYVDRVAPRVGRAARLSGILAALAGGVAGADGAADRERAASRSSPARALRGVPGARWRGLRGGGGPSDAARRLGRGRGRADRGARRSRGRARRPRRGDRRLRRSAESARPGTRACAVSWWRRTPRAPRRSGASRAARRDSRRAEADLRAAHELAPDDAAVKRSLAAILLERSAFEADDAVAAEAARRGEPSSRPTWRRRRPPSACRSRRRLDLAYELIDRGNIDAGIDQLRAVVREYPQNPQAARLLAQALVRLGTQQTQSRDYDGARESFTEAVELYARLLPCDGTRCDSSELELAHRNRILSALDAQRCDAARGGARRRPRRSGSHFPDLEKRWPELSRAADPRAARPRLLSCAANPRRNAMATHGGKLAARALKLAGVDCIFTLSRRAHHAHLRRRARRGHQDHRRAPRAGRGARGRRLQPAEPRQDRLRDRDRRPGRHRRRHRHRERLAREQPDPGDRRPGPVLEPAPRLAPGDGPRAR